MEGFGLCPVIIFIPSYSTPFASFMHKQPTAADNLFCGAHEEWMAESPGSGEWDEEDD